MNEIASSLTQSLRVVGFLPLAPPSPIGQGPVFSISVGERLISVVHRDGLVTLFEGHRKSPKRVHCAGRVVGARLLPGDRQVVVTDDGRIVCVDRWGTIISDFSISLKQELDPWREAALSSDGMLLLARRASGMLDLFAMSSGRKVWEFGAMAQEGDSIAGCGLAVGKDFGLIAGATAIRVLPFRTGAGQDIELAGTKEPFRIRGFSIDMTTGVGAAILATPTNHRPDSGVRLVRLSWNESSLQPLHADGSLGFGSSAEAIQHLTVRGYDLAASFQRGDRAVIRVWNLAGMSSESMQTVREEELAAGILSWVHSRRLIMSNGESRMMVIDRRDVAVKRTTVDARMQEDLLSSWGSQSWVKGLGAMTFVRQEQLSAPGPQFGGIPYALEQDWPICPGCQKKSGFLAQLPSRFFFAANGWTYLFICPHPATSDCVHQVIVGDGDERDKGVARNSRVRASMLPLCKIEFQKEQQRVVTGVHDIRCDHCGELMSHIATFDLSAAEGMVQYRMLVGKVLHLRLCKSCRLFKLG